MQDLHEKPKRAVVAAVQLPDASDVEFEASVAELRQLAKTLGFEVVGTFTQRRAKLDSVAYLGAGKRDELRCFVRNIDVSEHALDGALEQDEDEDAPDFDDEAAWQEADSAAHPTRAQRAAAIGAQRDEAAAKGAAKAPADPLTRRADVLLVDHEISPMRARNLEQDVGIEVMDRTMVILEIFHRHARSRAAKAQVEIVRLGYMAPRLREAAKLAGPQGRQRSGAGGRGAGESRGELDRRKIRDRIAELQKELVSIDAERLTQRSRRQDRSGLARVALVGYTNAGKSTLMRALTGSEVLVADKLFATLDTTVRALHPESVPRILVSDTVGFIKNLPHGLVASFKSTLEEALEASLLLHVIDASDPGFERQLQVTEAVLHEIGAKTVPRLLVFNKVDGVGDAQQQAERTAALMAQYPECMVLSARRPADIMALRDSIVAFFQQNVVEAELFLPWSAQQLRGEIFASCEVLEERADADGAYLRMRAEPAVIARLQEKLAPGSQGD
jgi:GTP-binding protein HflX